MMLYTYKKIAGSRSQCVLLACFGVGMIYVYSTGPVSTINTFPRGHPPASVGNSTEIMEFLKSKTMVQKIKSQQETRRTLLRQVCLKIGRMHPVPSKGLRSQHLIVDDDLRIIYCYVPKAASTNWKRVLLSLRDPRQTPLSIQPDASHKREWTVISSLKDKRLRDRNYFRFLVVRNPFERLLSAYRNKFEFPYNNYFRGRYGKNMKYYHQKKRPVLNATSNDGIPSFVDFLSYITSENSEKNEHWQAVNDICRPCDITYDFIGKYETLQQDSDFILNYIASSRNIHKNWSFPSRKETYTRTKPTGELMETYYKSIPIGIRSKVSESFGSDISLFGYSPLFLLSLTETHIDSNSSILD